MNRCTNTPTRSTSDQARRNVPLHRAVLPLILAATLVGCDALTGRGESDPALVHAFSVTALPDGGYAVLGDDPNGGDHIMTIHRYDAEDRLEWSRTYQYRSHVMGSGYLVVGSVGDLVQEAEMTVTKITDHGIPIWSRAIHAGKGIDAEPLEDGRTFVAGVEITTDHPEQPWMREYPYAAIVDVSGTIEWERTFKECGDNSFTNSTARLADGDIVHSTCRE